MKGELGESEGKGGKGQEQKGRKDCILRGSSIPVLPLIFYGYHRQWI